MKNYQDIIGKRVVELRAWNYDFSEMNFISSDTNNSKEDQNWCKFMNEIRKGILSDPMQWTGLFDMNKNKIWECDIVKYRLKSYNEKKREGIGVVGYDNEWGQYYIGTKLKNYSEIQKYPLGQCFVNTIIEIIGNIFKNPELVK